MSEWRRVRLRHVCDINPQTPEFLALRPDELVTFLPLEAIWPESLDTSLERPKHELESGYTRFREGDVLVPKITPTFEASRAVVARGLRNGVGCGTTELHVLRARSELDRRFLFYITHSHRFLAEGTGAMQGVAGQKRVPESVIADYVIDLPPLEEQRHIGEFLDRETARIDGVLEAHGRLLQLLEERSISLAWMAITGANRSEERRDSGLSWLGEVPASWPVVTVSGQFEVQLGRMLNPERAQGPNRAPYVRNANVRWDTVDVSDLAEMEFPPETRRQYRLQPGDVLINEGGAGMGRTAMWNSEVEDCYFQKSVLRLRPRSDANPRWIVECMRVAVAQNLFWIEGNVATIPHLPAETLRAHRFPFPLRAIQDRQLAWLDERRQDIGAAARSIREQIDLLRERRDALITAVVTGQLGPSDQAA